MRRLAVPLMVVLAAAAMPLPLAADDDPASLVERLPFDRDATSVESRRDDLVAALATHGDAAIDALQRELHLELRGRAEQQFTDSGKSKRYAVVRALGRIDTERSSRLLIETVRAFPDFNGLCDAVIHALDSRTLGESQLERLVSSACPPAAVYALRKAGTIRAGCPLRRVAEAVFDHDVARQQFRNFNGYPIGNEETLWEVRFAAGTALGVDMLPDMRRRTYTLVGELDAASHAEMAGPSVWLTSYSKVEIDINSAVARLVQLGDPVRDIVVNARKTAHDEFAQVLDFALLALGDKDRVKDVAVTLTDSPHPSLRICAARALLGAKDRRAIPALWKALADSFHRQSGACVRSPGSDGEVYPVRSIAARALVDLGEDRDLVSEKERAR
jgi:HEAT repeat protein